MVRRPADLGTTDRVTPDSVQPLTMRLGGRFNSPTDYAAIFRNQGTGGRAIQLQKSDASVMLDATDAGLALSGPVTFDGPVSITASELTQAALTVRNTLTGGAFALNSTTGTVSLLLVNDATAQFGVQIASNISYGGGYALDLRQRNTTVGIARFRGVNTTDLIVFTETGQQFRGAMTVIPLFAGTEGSLTVTGPTTLTGKNATAPALLVQNQGDGVGVGDHLRVVDSGNATKFSVSDSGTDVVGKLTATGAVTASTSLSVGTTLAVTGAATIGGTLGVTGAVTASAALSVGTTLGVTGAATLSSTLAVTGAITGASTVQGTRLISTVATGTAPLTVASQTLVTNLNAQLLNGVVASGYLDTSATGQTKTGNLAIGGTLGVTGAVTLTAGLSVGTTLGVTGAATLSSTLAVTSTATVGGTLGVTGATTLSSTLHAVGAVTMDAAATVGTTLGVTGVATHSSTTHMVGAVTMDAAATVGTTLGVTGAAAFSSTLHVVGAATFDSTLNFGGKASASFALASDAALSVTNTSSTSATAISAAATGTGGVGLSVSGAFGVIINTGGLFVTAGGATITAGGLVVTAGGATISAGGLSVVGSITGDTNVILANTGGATPGYGVKDTGGTARNIGRINSSDNMVIGDAGLSGTMVLRAATTGVQLGEAAAKVSIYGATPVAKQTVTGSRGGNAALADLLTKLATWGAITDGTTA